MEQFGIIGSGILDTTSLFRNRLQTSFQSLILTLGKRSSFFSSDSITSMIIFRFICSHCRGTTYITMLICHTLRLT
ncbi:unnamed protein product [Linum tenue]|uniref:Uncharacterized protein n=1 Tax=Linum tenue TaxID=586396 RepID=A0AAV0HR00_9ROSI|nr:unnamed protein product [Linum tenue]